MTVTKKQILPALHKSSGVKTPDLVDIGDKNYTSTILKYGNLALPFPQLETNAKTIVPAINELYSTKSSVVANPSELPTAPLTTIEIDGVVYSVEGSGGGSFKRFSGTNATDIVIPWDSYSHPNITDTTDTVICQVAFNYANFTPIKISHELNLNFDTEGSNVSYWYEMNYYLDGQLVDYKPREIGSTGYLDYEYSSLGVRICRDFFYTIDYATPNIPHIWEVHLVVHGVSVSIPANYFKVIVEGHSAEGEDDFEELTQIYDTTSYYEIGTLGLGGIAEDPPVITAGTAATTITTENGQNLITENGSNIIIE